jgi:hypothetical protein
MILRIFVAIALLCWAVFWISVLREDPIGPRAVRFALLSVGLVGVVLARRAYRPRSDEDDGSPVPRASRPFS